MKSISAKELCEKLKAGGNSVFLDVRSPVEYSGGHLPGSINIPLIGLLNRADELKGYDEIFVNCKSGGRSGVACVYLKQKGFDNVYNIEGGIDAWEKCR